MLVRLGLGALVVAPFAVADLRGRWGVLRAHAGLVLLYGAVPMALAQFAYFSAVARMAVGPALLIEYTAPAAVVGWLWLRRGERPSAMTLAGAAVCLVGLVLVLDLLAGPSLNPIGVAWALVAMVGAPRYFVLGSDGIAAVPAVGLAGCGLVAATVSLGLLGAIGVLPLRAATARRATPASRSCGGCRCSRSARSPVASPTAPGSPRSGGSARAWRRSSGCSRSSPASSGPGCCSPRCPARCSSSVACCCSPGSSSCGSASGTRRQATWLPDAERLVRRSASP